MVNTLKVKKVVDLRLPGAVLAGSRGCRSITYLKAHGVTTIRLSAPNTTTDYSSYVTKVPSDADVVFFPTQQPPAAQTFAEQLVEQGKKAVMFSGDGSDASAAVQQADRRIRLQSSRRTSPTSRPTRRSSRRGRRPTRARPSARSVRRPTAPSQVILNAIKLACAKGHGTLASRADVFHQVKKVHDQELDPRRELQVLDEDQRSAEREVLRLQDPVRRLVQARRLGRQSSVGAARA